jgi:hypothetical protein
MRGFRIVMPGFHVLAFWLKTSLSLWALPQQTHAALRDPEPRRAFRVVFGKSRLLLSVCCLTAVFLTARALLRTTPACRSTHFSE